MPTVSKILPRGGGLAGALVKRLPVVELEWDVRQRSRFEATASDGALLQVFLPRGAVVRGGDVLVADDGSLRVVRAAAEAVLVVRACAEHGSPHDLLRAAYHLGNRHVALELQADCLLLEPDHVLADMLRRMHLDVTEATRAFEPEAGAYAEGAAGHAHGHGHGHDHGHDHAHDGGSHAHDDDEHGRSHQHARHEHGQSHDHGHSHPAGSAQEHRHSHEHGAHHDASHDHGHSPGAGSPLEPRHADDHRHEHGHEPEHEHEHDRDAATQRHAQSHAHAELGQAHAGHEPHGGSADAGSRERHEQAHGTRDTLPDSAANAANPPAPSERGG